jgi:nucleoside-diphosphate-sugar epimerase
MGIVVTGGAGFIGHHLLARLCANRTAFGAADEPIVVIDNFHRGSPDAMRDLAASGAIHVIEGDIRDEALLAQALRGAEYVFHLAAQSNVMGAEADPEYAYSTNVTGTQRVLQAAIAAGARRVVFSSSREVYGQPASLPVAETVSLAPKNTYGATKAAAEMLCRAAATRGELEIVALRLANVYGSGDTGRVTPLWLDRAARGEELIVYGGTQVLDLIWVDDVVSALICAALVPDTNFAATGAVAPDAGAGFFAALNVGTGQGTPLTILAERIRMLTNRNVTVRLAAARPAEVERFVADTTLMHRTLDLRPDAPLTHLHILADEALQRAGAAKVEMPASAATPARHPHLTLVSREGM